MKCVQGNGKSKNNGQLSG